jgi:malonyl-CoA/methylmalonyl-CoA synthetase
MTNHLFDVFRGAARFDGAPFIRTLPGRVITYGEAFDLAGRMANVLVGEGVAPGDRVAVQVEKSPEALILYLACVRAGAVFVPLNPAYTAAEVDYFIGDAGPKVFVQQTPSPPQGERVGERGAIRMLALSMLLKTNRPLSPALPPDGGEGALAAILYTSGTTGKSKGAMLTHGNLASNAIALRDTWRWTRDDVLIHALPIFHTHGLFVATNVTLVSGASMILLPKFDADAIFAAMPQATTMMGVPTFYTRLLQDKRLTREATKHMRLFVSGSAPLLAETHREWRERTGHAILERYGMTETNMNTSNLYDGERVPGSVGVPLPGTEIRIADPDPETGVGMIEVRGPNVFKGYWQQPEKTAESFRDHWFVTGDLGRIDERGYLYIAGRGKDLIITGGFNVYPKEIEDELDALPGVGESAVIGVPHPDFGEAVTAVMTARPGVQLSEKDILTGLKSRLANYKLPKRVLFVAELPRNTMGKVQKNVLRETYAELYGATR